MLHKWDLERRQRRLIRSVLPVNDDLQEEHSISVRMCFGRCPACDRVARTATWWEYTVYVAPGEMPATEFAKWQQDKATIRQRTCPVSPISCDIDDELHDLGLVIYHTLPYPYDFGKEESVVGNHRYY